MANGITAARRVLDLQPPHFAGINTKQRMVAYTRQVDVASLYHEGSVLIADTDNHRVMLFAPGIFDGVVVAGGKGRGFGLDQLNGPSDVELGRDGSLFISDAGNHRVACWHPRRLARLLGARWQWFRG